MNRTTIDGAEVAFTDTAGDGEPLLLMHGGGLADWMTPLAGTPELTDFRVIRMIRAGHLGQSAAGLTVADHARHAATLLRRLEAAPAHVVAHSSGSAFALQLAADDPSAVRTLTLVEPPMVDTLADPADLDALHAAFGPVMGASMGAIAQGDYPAAFDAFMTLVCGPDYRRVVNTVIGAEIVDEAARNSLHFFTGEVAALNSWEFNPAITAPVLLIQGAGSPALQHRLIGHLAGRLPDSAVATVENANHLMPLTRPAEIGRLAAAFARSHEEAMPRMR